MLKNKKSQIISEIFKYALVGLVAALVLILGYKGITSVKDKGCSTEMVKFETEIKNIGGTLRYGTKELQSFSAPCGADKLYFIDSKAELGGISNPLIKDAVKGSTANLFLLKDATLEKSLDIGSIEIGGNHILCLLPKSGRILVFVEGAGNSVKVSPGKDQPTC